jgi:lysophospholipase L1-like esterase
VNTRFENRLSAKILLAFVSLVASGALLETIVRAGGLWIKVDYDERNYYSLTSIPGVPYTLKPGIDTVWARTRIVANAEGIRDTRELGNKTKDVYRILVLGDSVTFGFGVQQEKAYPQQMEVLLKEVNQASQLHYEVVNAGIDGFNVENEANFLRYLLPRVRPDLIVWSLVSNDWDDSLSGTADGRITTREPSYAAALEWLDFSWGLQGDFVYQDFFQCMDERHQCWAFEKPYIPHRTFLDKLDETLQNLSYGYCWLRSRRVYFEGKPSIMRSVPPNAWSRRTDFTSQNGVRDLLPEIKPISLSPYFNKRFYKSIKLGAAQARKWDIPMVIFGWNINLDQNQIPSGIHYRDISEYFGMPYDQFRQAYNLGWDGHFNAAGNRVIAQSMIQSLVEMGLLGHISSRWRREIYPKDQYWRQAESDEKDLVNSFMLPYVDLDGFKGVFQLVGGLYPPRTFPIKGGAQVSLILRQTEEGLAQLELTGTNFSSRPQVMEVTVGNGESESPLTLEWPPGFGRHRRGIPWLLNQTSSPIIDVQLRSLSSPAPWLQLRSVGLKSAKD